MTVRTIEFYRSLSGRCHAFAKKAQKTPPQEIDLAIQRKHDYLARRKA